MKTTPFKRLLFTAFALTYASFAMAGEYTLTISGENMYLNGEAFLVKGLRCSNALQSDSSTADLIRHLDTFASYGINTVSVYFMGSRFGDVKGYRPDATIDPVYGARMERIIRAADRRGMVVLVGVLYWGNSKGKVETWEQADAERAVAGTVAWLKERDFRNVFIDIDNEGMAERARAFDPEGMIRTGKAVDPTVLLAYNGRGTPPADADLHIHFSDPIPGKPYVESEGTVSAGTPDGYWSSYSKVDGLYNYINVGIHNEAYQEAQNKATADHLRRNQGYMLASTWLQAVPPKGPNQRPGGMGTPENPGIRWWLEYVRDEFGPYIPPVPPHVKVRIVTPLGDIVLAVYEEAAPVSAGNFLRYIDEARFHGASFFRTVTMDNQPRDSIRIEVIQGGFDVEDSKRLPPIPHETTLQTGIRHMDDALSMARSEPGSASTSFFICIGDQPDLDFGGMRNPDGQGFSAFGRVISGMDVVRKIQRQPSEGQQLTPNINILSVTRLE